jgi:hypothetical protein
MVEEVKQSVRERFSAGNARIWAGLGGFLENPPDAKTVAIIGKTRCLGRLGGMEHNSFLRGKIWKSTSFEALLAEKDFCAGEIGCRSDHSQDGKAFLKKFETNKTMAEGVKQGMGERFLAGNARIWAGLGGFLENPPDVKTVAIIGKTRCLGRLGGLSRNSFLCGKIDIQPSPKDLLAP